MFERFGVCAGAVVGLFAAVGWAQTTPVDGGMNPQCSPGTGAPNCAQCPAGFQGNGGFEPCSQCPAGFFSVPGSASCTQCPNGSSSTSGSARCTAVVDAGVPVQDTAGAPSGGESGGGASTNSGEPASVVSVPEEEKRGCGCGAGGAGFVAFLGGIIALTPRRRINR